MEGRAVGGAAARAAARWKNYLLLVYTAAALAALLVVTNLIIVDHNVRWDLTPNKRYVLSPFDRRVLAGLKSDVTVTVFARAEDPSYLELAELLSRVAAFSSHVTWRVLDLNKAPGLARQYAVSTYGEVIVESERRRRDFDSARPELLMAAILQVSGASQKRLYFTAGHGEASLLDAEANHGYSQWRGLLEQNNYRIENLSLLAGEVPADASAVVALGPRKDFMPHELSALARYLARGGHLLALIDAEAASNLVEFLGRYYLDFDSRVVIDPADRLAGGELLTSLMPLYSARDPMTRAMAAPAVFSMSRAVSVAGKPGERAPDGLVLVRGDSFLRSSPESWASGDPKVLTAGVTGFKAKRDIRGPVAVGSEVDLAPAGNARVPVENMARIVGFGSSAFASNQFLYVLGNRELALSVVNELAGDEILIASRERLKAAPSAGLYVTDEQARRILWIGAVIEPALLFLVAIAVAARRRFFA